MGLSLPQHLMGRGVLVACGAAAFFGRSGCSADKNIMGEKKMIEPESAEAFLEGLLFPAILAACGGIARVCRFGVRGWRQFGGSIVVSAFTGVVVHLALDETGLSNSLQAAVVAASGYSGGAILDAFAAGVMSRLQRSAEGLGSKAGKENKRV